MRNRALCMGIFLLLGSSALGQSYNMTVHLSGGRTIIIPLDEIRVIELAGLTEIEDPEKIPRDFQLLQNYPNPFNPSTTIDYEIPNTANVTVRIYNLQGALIAELVNEVQARGWQQTAWDGTDSRRAPVSSGVYLCVVECGATTLSRKLILVR